MCTVLRFCFAAGHVVCASVVSLVAGQGESGRFATVSHPHEYEDACFHSQGAAK